MLSRYPDWPDTPPDMVGYDWHRDEGISRRGEGEFSPDLVARYWCRPH